MFLPYSLYVTRLIQATVAVSVICILLDNLFSLGLQQVLVLTPEFYASYFLWQPLTSLFLLASNAISFGYLLDLGFLMLLLWMLGNQVVEFMGVRRFQLLYFGAAAAAAITSLLVMYFTHTWSALSLLPAALLGVATVWAMCSSSQTVLVYFFFPVPAKWCLAVALVGTILTNVMQGDFVHAGAYAGAFVYSYLLGVMGWYLKGPYECLWRFDALLKRCAFRIKTFWQWWVRRGR